MQSHIRSVGTITYELRVPHREFKEKDHGIQVKWATPPIVNLF